jgi:hypothetical protein
MVSWFYRPAYLAATSAATYFYQNSDRYYAVVLHWLFRLVCVELTFWYKGKRFLPVFALFTHSLFLPIHSLIHLHDWKPDKRVELLCLWTSLDWNDCSYSVQNLVLELIWPLWGNEDHVYLFSLIGYTVVTVHRVFWCHVSQNTCTNSLLTISLVVEALKLQHWRCVVSTQTVT